LFVAPERLLLEVDVEQIAMQIENSQLERNAPWKR
jgi:hypothetical protein